MPGMPVSVPSAPAPARPEAPPAAPLRRGWTTGACAAAASRAAYQALVTGDFPDPVTVRLPKGQEPAFPLARQALEAGRASAGIVKDAGDDPDVTHGALVLATVTRAAPGRGVMFQAGEGVGTVTRAGLPVPPGEPAINPGPRQLIAAQIAELAARLGDPGDVTVEIAVPGGAALAERTLNGRLGVVGGLSILGTTGIVVPFSCAAWIHSIHRGVDVARAAGLEHIAGATGSTSEAAVRRLHGLADQALVDMGDFAGALLKYLRRHPVPRLTIAGGFGKIGKLGAGHLDLHSGRSAVDLPWLAEVAAAAGGSDALARAIRAANTASETLGLAEAEGVPLADAVAARARDTARRTVDDRVAVEVVIFDRKGALAGRAGP